MTYNEIDPFACDWLASLADAGEIPAGRIDQRSIKELTGDDCDATTHFFAGVAGWPLALRLAGWPIREARRNRVGRLKGYGNAIVPHAAVEFLRLVMEIVE